jgi:hypothetical protein
MKGAAVEAFPLCWPPGRPRSAAPQSSQFKVTLGAAVAHVRREVGALGGSELVISTNMPLRRDGVPLTPRGGIRDAGVAVYFTLRKAPMCFACDRWEGVEENLRAIAKTVEALRGIERWGSGQMAAQAFTGFTALPSPPQWWQILKVKSTASRQEIEAAYRELAWSHHPDRVAAEVSGDMMARINRARDQGLEQFE